MMGWRAAKIGDEIELGYGKPLPSQHREAGVFKVYGSNGIVGVHSEALVPGPGIVVGRKGSSGEVVFSPDAFWPIDTTYFVRNTGGHDWRFLYHFLRSKQLNKIDRPSPVPGLNREDVYALDAEFPELDEQRLIASVLDAVEASIDIEEQAQAGSESLKRAAMRDLFTKGLRGEVQKETDIGLVPESWDVVPLGSLGRVGNGSTPKKTIPEYWTNGTYPWLTSAKVYEREIVEADHFVTDVALRECHLPRVEPGAILIAITGQGKTLGHCAVLRTQATINQHIAYVSTDTSRANPSFVRGYLETQYDYLRQVGSAGGSTKGALTCAFLRSLPIPLPPTLDEQREIVEILDVIDQKISLHQRKCAILEDLSTALLYKLMNGELRVADLDLSALGEASLEGVAA